MDYNEYNDEDQTNEDVKKIWANLQPILEGEVHDATKPLGPKTKLYNIGFLSRIAASIILVAVFSFWYFNSKKDPPVASGKASIIEKSNPKGRRSTITLTDGSTVVLNSESTLLYSSNFGDSTRELTLTGEAFFEVMKNPRKPFIVKSGDVMTTALGTSFNIRSYPDDIEITVSLITGRVKVMEISEGNTDKSYILNSGEQIKYAKGARVFKKLRNEDDAVYLWKDGILSFDQASLKDIVQKLERWYGVNVHLSNRSNSMVKYNGIYINQSLENVMKAMSFSLNFEFLIEDKDIKIIFN